MSLTIHSVSSPVPYPPIKYPFGLTTKDVIVIQMLADGLSQKQIADELETSLGSVKNRLRTIRFKTQKDSTIAVVAWALRQKVAF